MGVGKSKTLYTVEKIDTKELIVGLMDHSIFALKNYENVRQGLQSMYFTIKHPKTSCAKTLRQIIFFARKGPKTFSIEDTLVFTNV